MSPISLCDLSGRTVFFHAGKEAYKKRKAEMNASTEKNRVKKNHFEKQDKTTNESVTWLGKRQQTHAEISVELSKTNGESK